jgi:hypothetical protein
VGPGFFIRLGAETVDRGAKLSFRLFADAIFCTALVIFVIATIICCKYFGGKKTGWNGLEEKCP